MVQHSAGANGGIGPEMNKGFPPPRVFSNIFTTKETLCMSVTSFPTDDRPKAPRRLLRSASRAGTSLVETVVTMAITALALSAFFASSAQAIRLIKSGKNRANASQLLQLRMEGLRLNSDWAKITTGAGLQSLISSTAPMAANFPGATEVYTVIPYTLSNTPLALPAGVTPLVVTRTASGGVTFTGSDLSSQRAVVVTIQVSWSGVGARLEKNLLSTVISKGGL